MTRGRRVYELEHLFFFLTQLFPVELLQSPGLLLKLDRVVYHVLSLCRIEHLWVGQIEYSPHVVSVVSLGEHEAAGEGLGQWAFD